jgi:hypothetical protein
VLLEFDSKTKTLGIRNSPLSLYPLPTWFTDRENTDIISASLPPKYILHKYTLFHDIGKPYCKVVDDEGKVHFPNHAEISAKKYLELFPWEKEVAELIRQDMIIHTIKEEGMENFSRNKHAIALLLVGLAEVLSNAYMFGGHESESFKIKFKQIEKRGNSLFRKLKERNRENDC